VEDERHPGDFEIHIIRDLGFDVAPVGDGMHGAGRVIPEMWTPGTTAVRTSILAAWADVVCGYAAIGLFEPAVPVTLDLDVHLHRHPAGCEAIEMDARVQKSGRSVAVLSIDIAEGGGRPLGFAHATFMAAPNPSLRMPTIVRDEGLLHPHPPSLDVPFAERAGCERTGVGTASIPMRPDGLNASGTMNGALLALVVEEAALSTGPTVGVSSLSMRFARPVRVGPAVARAEVNEGLGRVTVHDQGHDDRLAVIATTRSFDP